MSSSTRSGALPAGTGPGGCRQRGRPRRRQARAGRAQPDPPVVPRDLVRAARRVALRLRDLAAGHRSRGVGRRPTRPACSGSPPAPTRSGARQQGFGAWASPPRTPEGSACSVTGGRTTSVDRRGRRGQRLADRQAPDPRRLPGPACWRRARPPRGRSTATPGTWSTSTPPPSKGPESPGRRPSARRSPTGDIRSGGGYFVQNGPDKYGSSYTRAAGRLDPALARRLPADAPRGLRAALALRRRPRLAARVRRPGAVLPAGRARDRGRRRRRRPGASRRSSSPTATTTRCAGSRSSYSDQVLAGAIDGMRVTLGGEPIARAGAQLPGGAQLGPARRLPAGRRRRRGRRRAMT